MPSERIRQIVKKMKRKSPAMMKRSRSAIGKNVPSFGKFGSKADLGKLDPRLGAKFRGARFVKRAK